MEPNLPATEDASSDEPTNWDYAEEILRATTASWNERDDPCKAAYYRSRQNIRDARNLLASNIGMVAKREPRGKLLVVATELRHARSRCQA